MLSHDQPGSCPFTPGSHDVVADPATTPIKRPQLPPATDKQRWYLRLLECPVWNDPSLDVKEASRLIDERKGGAR